MKRSKLLTGMLAAMIALFATACSNDENIPGTTGNGDGVITFTVNPDYGVKTRAGGTINTIPADKALRCIMELYDADGNYVDKSQQVKSITTTTEPIEFVVKKETGANCTAVFWADFTKSTDAETDLYYSTASRLKAVTFNTNNKDDFNGEAFYGTAAIDATGKPETTAVTLTHAIAMVTLKTTEQLKKAKSVKVTYGDTGATMAPKSTFNALEGTTAGTATTIDKVNKVDATKVATKDSPYDFHTFYVFAPKDTKDVINMTVEICSDDNGKTSEQETKISNVPIRANYRTNIKGDFSLAIFTISCSSDWTDELTPPSVWDGTSGKTANAQYAFSGGAGTSVDDPYLIGSATDLAQLAANVNGGTNYDGKYFKLTTDIDLNNEEWTPIGKFIDYVDVGNKPFKGDFDGNQKQITGLKISNNDLNSIGLFGYTEANDKSLKNLHVNGNITYSPQNAGSGNLRIGGICGEHGWKSIENCSFNGEINVTNAPNGSDNVSIGGIAGETNGWILGCKNSGDISADKGDIGGISGFLLSGTHVYACYNKGNITATGSNLMSLAGIAASGDAGTYIVGCYNIGSISAGSNGSAQVEAITTNTAQDSSKECYVTTNPNNDLNVTVFSDSAWPTSLQTGDLWYADSSNDGSYTYDDSTQEFSDCKFWKSLGGWNTGGSTIVYPKLWWE